MSNDVLRNLFRLLNIAWVRRYTIFIPMLIMPVVGFAVSFMTPKFYEAHTTILLQDTSELNPILEDFSISTNLEERQAALEDSAEKPECTGGCGHGSWLYQRRFYPEGSGRTAK